ncbi:hypothetical protein FHS14_002059 [Paenibacillus baekrokdamisoli]|nr:hypothetical protein [Paenibacillus baekrokdamisoli]
MMFWAASSIKRKRRLMMLFSLGKCFLSTLMRLLGYTYIRAGQVGRNRFVLAGSTE